MASVQPGHSHGDLHDDESLLDDDLIEADHGAPSLRDFGSPRSYDPHLNFLTHIEPLDIEADDPLHTSDTAPLRGNIASDSGSRANRVDGYGNYLTSSIPGEDRRATQNTIDESVWETLSRDLLAVWEKMRQVLWPKYLLGGMMMRGGGGMGDAAERGEASGFGRNLRGLVGRWPDADVVLQGGMSEGLRDWDLWYVARMAIAALELWYCSQGLMACLGVRLSSACF